MTSLDPWRVVAAIAVLLVILVVVLTVAGVRIRRDALVATARAGAQLAVVALVIAWVFRHPEGIVVYVVVMLVAATATATRRVACGRATVPVIGTAIAAGAVVTVVPVWLSGALETTPEALVPFAAQIVGGAMIGSSLTGARLRDDVRSGWDQVEAWLSLGATPAQAVAPYGRTAIGAALAPPVDQTRSAGLVTLPGAFVGLLLGGATPAEAAFVQVLVLVGLLVAECVAGVVTARGLGPVLGAHRPEDAATG
ncbi:ABC transporter permease [Aeromicrobium alkaliterrae]